MKAGNYWRWLKRKLTVDGVQLVSVTHDFKFEAPDGKQRASDALDTARVQTLAKHYPANRANAFLDWFTYSDNTIDGQSKKKGMTFLKAVYWSLLSQGQADSRLYFWRSVQFCGADSYQEYQQRWIHLCQCSALFRHSSEHRKKCQKTLSTRLRTNMLR